MSGAYVPYHLRTNKAVERQLFLEVLKKINDFYQLNKYEYVGFGGNFLEDYKLLGTLFDFREMISIERDQSVYKRQLFNLPSKKITCTRQESYDFIDDLDRSITTSKLVIWLDYANADLKQQLREVADLAPKLINGDVLKITFNAEPNSIKFRAPKVPQGALRPNRNKLRLEKFQKLTSRYFPNSFAEYEHMSDVKKYPQLLKETLHLLVDSIFNVSSSLMFQPLTSYFYKDGAQMFTLTGIVLDKATLKPFMNKTKLYDWNLSNLKWSDKPIEINVPWLSIKEKAVLDSYLPEADEDILRRVHDDTNVSLCDEEQDSFELFKEYAKYSRYVSQFMKVSV